MNNGEKELTKTLDAIESEIMALKTAHKRPLGALNFFQKAVSIPVKFTDWDGFYTSNIKVVVKIATPSVKPPIVQAGWGIPAGFRMVNFYGVEPSSDYTTWTYDLNLAGTTSSATLPFGVLSSQPIESIAWRFT